MKVKILLFHYYCFINCTTYSILLVEMNNLHEKSPLYFTRS